MRELWGEEESKFTPDATSWFRRGQEGISKSLLNAVAPDASRSPCRCRWYKHHSKAEARFQSGQASAAPVEGVRPNAAAVWGRRKLLLQLFCCGIQPRS